MIFDELNAYSPRDHFFFEPQQSLTKVCNAPTDKSGVYLVYALKKGKIELIYIGRSGKIQENGKMFVRKAGLGGLMDRIVNGKQFGSPRRIAWADKMVEEGIEALDVYWYVTQTKDQIYCPAEIEKLLLMGHTNLFGYRPRWNKK